jgi:uncharacterized protein YecA (UPF0149 family)
VEENGEELKMATSLDSTTIVIQSDFTATSYKAMLQRAEEICDEQLRNYPKRAVAVRREGPRIRRNAPCPCGSGKKFKHCHRRN